ncbi:MAG: RNA polymerase sigma factor [Micromonosporaceae bacterium]
MRDRDMVAAIVAGDPAGLAAAYDRHAADLYAYCRFLLTESGAAEAVRDTFIIALAKLWHLRDPDLARAWLFAVARGVCHRRLRDATAAAWPARVDDVAGAPAGSSAGSSAGAGRSAARELVDCAIRSLNTTERDAVELCMRHDIGEAGLAATLGISPHRAHTLVSRARRKFTASLGALLVARAGPQFCPDLATYLTGWDGELTGPLRRQLDTHIRRCAVCGERKRRKLRATMLLGLAAPTELPGEVWPEILGLVSGTTPGGAAYRTDIAARAEPFGKSGFPAPLGPRPAARPPARVMLTTLAGLTAFAAIGAGTVITTNMPYRGKPPHRPGSALGVHAPKPATVPKAPPAAAGHTRVAHHRPAPVATPVPAPAPTAVPTAPAPPTAPAGTLSVWPTTVTLRPSGNDGPPTGSFTLTANGGPVAAFTITISAGHAGDLIVVPATGALAAGQSIEVSATLRSGHHGRLHTRLGMQPGGLSVTVVYQPPRD